MAPESLDFSFRAGSRGVLPLQPLTEAPHAWPNALLSWVRIPGQRENVRCACLHFLASPSHKSFVKLATWLPKPTYLVLALSLEKLPGITEVEDRGSEVLKARKTTLSFRTRAGFECRKKAMVV